jgi:hypothetical protein
MANIINIPFANSIRFAIEAYIVPQQYNTPTFDESLFENQILNFQQSKKYYQKVQKTENISFQFSTNYGPVSARLIDCKKNLIANATITQPPTSIFTPPFTGYLANIDISSVQEGEYWVQVLVGVPEVSIISEPIYINDFHANTMMFEYSNSENDYGVVFQNGETFQFRCEAALVDFQPGSIETVYEDEIADLVRLSSSPFRTWKLKIGTAQGVPDWVADKINRIFACDNVLIDGKPFTKNEGSKMERNGNPLTQMAGWTFEVRESKARQGLTIQNNIPLNQRVDVIYITDTSFFGPVGSAGTSIIIKTD